jgi:hypothetical protein
VVEIPRDDLANELRKSGVAARARGNNTFKASERSKQLGKNLRFLFPSDGPLTLANTGARLYCLGALRDKHSISAIYSRGDLVLDFAIELAGGDVLLFADSPGDIVWSNGPVAGTRA